jgi:carbon-monoxide dehydrogenase large subunit
MIGTSPRRKEDLRLLTGAGRFLDDLTRPGMVHLGVVRSVHAHARVLKVTARESLARPGVLAVQFHPEKSGAYGAALLARWLESPC